MIENTIIISEQGTRLSKKGHSLVLFKQREKIFVYPLANLRRLILMGRVELASALVGVLMRLEVDVVFTTQDGRFRARLSGPQSKNVFIRQTQYERMKEREFVLQAARETVRAKVRNYGRMIQKSRRISFEIFKKRLENMVRGVDAAPSLDTLRGLEGSFSALYFRYFPSMLRETMGFKKRIKHPPPDPLNSMLSLGYTLLYNSMHGLVEAAGLDPYVGYFHQMKYGHAALVSDLIEPFRAPLVDRLVIALVNRRQVSADDFEIDERCIFSRQGLGLFMDAWRKRISEKFLVGELKLNYLQLMQEQVRRFVRFMEGKDERYHIFEYR